MTGKTVTARLSLFAPPSTDPDLNDRARLRRSLAFAALFWILVVSLAFSLAHTKAREPKRAFQSIQINLAPVQRVAEQQPAQSSAKPTKAQSAESPRAAAPRASRKARAASRDSGQAAPAQSSGLGIPDFAPSTREQSRRDAGADSLEFGTTENAPDSGVQARTGTKPAPAAVPEIEGTVATVQKSSGGTVRSSSGAKTGSDGTPRASGETTRASAETTRALGDIAGSTVSGSASQEASHGSGTSTETRGTTGAEAARASATLSGISFEGAPRKALYAPPIVLPENLARLVNASVSVTVAFTVLADGSVPAAFVDFIPQASLPAAVRDYLVKEFSRWRFEKSDQDGHARFLYSIRVQ